MDCLGLDELPMHYTRYGAWNSRCRPRVLWFLYIIYYAYINKHINKHINNKYIIRILCLYYAYINKYIMLILCLYYTYIMLILFLGRFRPPALEVFGMTCPFFSVREVYQIDRRWQEKNELKNVFFCFIFFSTLGRGYSILLPVQSTNHHHYYG